MCLIRFITNNIFSQDDEIIFFYNLALNKILGLLEGESPQGFLSAEKPKLS